MTQPAFWFTPPGPLAGALAPLSVAWSLATSLRLCRRAGNRVPVPVLCVGNINIGGTGKTPTVMALTERLQRAGWTPGIVTRGYRGRLAGPIEVDAARHTAADVGDEALVLASLARTWKATNRPVGVQQALHAGCDIIIMDDGHQSPAPPRDLALLTVDALAGFGNGRVLPAGPLREPIARGLARADLLLVIGQPADREAFLDAWRAMITVPILSGQIEVLPTGLDWPGMVVYGFAGMAHPEKFRRSLAATGARVIKFRPLADHQPLAERLMGRMEAEAAALGAQLITTEKDAARLPPSWRQRILVLPVRLRIDDWQPIDDHLARLRPQCPGQVQARHG